MKINRLGVFLGLFLSSALLYAQAPKSLIGQPAPAVRFEKLINYPAPSAAASDFKSRLLIIDFWATWCAPCIASFPHLEELQKKYADKIQIITVTDETEERIKQFLTKKSVSLPIAFDTGGQLAAAFPYRSLPHTIVIDSKNTVRAVTTSAAITSEVIDRILADQAIGLEEKKEDFKFSAAQPLSGRQDSIYQMTLLPFQEGFPEGMIVSYNAGTSIYAKRRILITNAALPALYETAFQFPAGVRTVIEARDQTAFEWSRQTAYSYELIVPPALGEQRFAIMRRHLSEIFPYRSSVEKRSADVKILRRINDQPFPVKPSAGGKTRAVSGGQGLEMTNSAFGKVPAFLETTLHCIVIDETGVAGNFDLNIPYFNEDPDRIYEQLKKIGLELVGEKRTVEMLVISDAPSAGSK